MFKKYIAECIGTFALAFVVLIALAAGNTLVPVIAGFTLMLFVYSIGAISGCHINPSVTIGLWSIKKIGMRDAIWYIIAQFLGAFLAIVVAGFFQKTVPANSGNFSSGIFFAEMLGAIFFNFGIASVVFGKSKEQMSGLVVGGSLTLGVIISIFLGAAGILNPAVAFAVNSLTLTYLLAPILGAVIGAKLYKSIA